MTKLTAYRRNVAVAINKSSNYGCLELLVGNSILILAVLDNKLIACVYALNRNCYSYVTSCEVSSGLIDVTAECTERN